MENNVQIGVSRVWKRISLFLGFIIILYGLSVYFKRATFITEPSSKPFIKTSTTIFMDSEYLVVFLSSAWPHIYNTASVETEGRQLNVYFKRRASLVPSVPFGNNTTTFGYPWAQVFAFEIIDNIDVVVDASTGAVLWQRVSAETDE